MTTAERHRSVKDYYDILGVSRSANDADIKKAYRRLARKYHPDVSKEPDSEQRFKEMKEAYDVLRNPEKRAAYDQFGHNWRAGPDFGRGTGQEYQSPFGGMSFDGAEPFGDIFDQIFGRGSSGRHGFERGFTSRAREGDDLQAKIQLTLEEAYRGGTRQISLDLPSRDADGRTVSVTRKLNVRIPKGVTAGQKIRLADQGGAGIGQGATRGDLYLEVDIRPHRYFRLDGKDIHVDVPVTPWEAALGRTIKVPTLGGDVDLKIPAGSGSGKQLRLKGRGFPGTPPGDQYVHLQIVLPRETSAAARSHYESLERMHTFDPRKSLR